MDLMITLHCEGLQSVLFLKNHIFLLQKQNIKLSEKQI